MRSVQCGHKQIMTNGCQAAPRRERWAANPFVFGLKSSMCKPSAAQQQGKQDSTSHPEGSLRALGVTRCGNNGRWSAPRDVGFSGIIARQHQATNRRPPTNDTRSHCDLSLPSLYARLPLGCCCPPPAPPLPLLLHQCCCCCAADQEAAPYTAAAAAASAPAAACAAASAECCTASVVEGWRRAQRVPPAPLHVLPRSRVR